MRFYVILLSKTTEMLFVVSGISTLILFSNNKIVASLFLLVSLMQLASNYFYSISAVASVPPAVGLCDVHIDYSVSVVTAVANGLAAFRVSRVITIA